MAGFSLLLLIRGDIHLYYRSRAIILKSKDYRDADKLLTVFSEKEGKLHAIARGVKKPKSSLRASLQPFCHSMLFFHRGKDLDLITQTRLLSFYGNIRENLGLTLQVVYILELLDRSLMARAPQPSLYKDMLDILDWLEQKGFNPLMIRLAELSTLVNLGYQPVLHACAVCAGEANLEGWFDLEAGGLICRSCRLPSQYQLLLGREAVAILRLMMRSTVQAVARIKASPIAIQQIEIFLERYLEYYLENRFKIKDTIKSLKSILSGLNNQQ